MTFAQWAGLGLGLTVAAVAALFILVWHLAYKDGYNDGRDYEKQRAYLRALRAEKSADRARARQSSSPAAAPWYQPVPPRPRTSRVVTTAGDIAPVTVVPVGPAVIPLRPQPSRISGAGTVPLSALTTTGEMRAATTEFIAKRIVAQSERDRQEITS